MVEHLLACTNLGLIPSTRKKREEGEGRVRGEGSGEDKTTMMYVKSS